jgi:heavy metal efflux pump (cobalt-zinc-cadmium)
VVRLIEFSLRHRAFILVATAALVVAGLWSAARLPIDAVPDITNVQVQINTAVPALAPEEIEKLVTYPIEIEMGGLERLEEIRSLSKFGLSQVTLIFADGTDLYRVRQLVGERLLSVTDDLPAGATPKLAPITTGLGEIYHYVVRFAPDAAVTLPADPVERLRELTLIQDYVVAPALRTVPGITEVNTSGGYERQVVVQPDPARLVSAGLTVSEVAAIIAENVANAGGSVVEKAGEAVLVRSVGRVETLGQIASLPLKFSGAATPLLVGDVATVAIGSSQRTGTATHNGDEAVLGSALMLIGENSRVVARRVDEKLAALRATLPPHVVVESVYDRTSLVDATLRTVRTNLFEGALLVIAVLVALLGNWRAALIVASAIPLSLLFAITGMTRFGVSGNLMSLGAIDFGLIVDGAIVMAENIVRRLAARQHELDRPLDSAERHATILAACRQVARPAVFGVAIITIVYLPIFSLTGIEGKMFQPMAFTVVLALAGALLLALTLVPVLATFFLNRPVRERDSALIRAAKRLYAPVLAAALRLRWFVVLSATALFAFSLWLFPRLGAEFIPQLDEGSLAIQMIRTTSIGLGPSLDMQSAAEKLLREKFPEITHTFSRIGTSEVATDPMGVNIGDTYVMLSPPPTWRKIDGRRIAKDELAALMSAELTRRFPGQSHLFSQPIELRFNEILSGSRADLSIKIFGHDYDVLERLAAEIREIVEHIPGAAEVEFDAAGRSPVLQISANRPAMARYNVHSAELNREIETAFAGADAGLMIEGDRRSPIVTRLAESHRADFSNIANLPVRTNDGGYVSLGQVAEVSVVEDVSTIQREAFRRRLAVQVNLRGRDVQSFVDEARRRIAESVTLPDGYAIEYGGAFRNLQQARARLAVVVPLALASIVLLAYFALGRFTQTAIVCTGVPLAITGGIFALWLRDLPFSISAAVGFIALSGVAVLNGVVMLTFINELRAGGRSVYDAVVEGALTRLRPVLMTALGASLGFIPMALATGPGAEVQRPLATVVIGGVITSTLLTLLVLPALCRLMQNDRTTR